MEGKRNENRDFMLSDYGAEKVSKDKELNDTMTIVETGADEYEQTIMNIGGTR